MNEAELETYLRASSQRKGVDLMTAPSITVRQGESASAQVGRPFRYPESAEPETTMAEEFVGVTNHLRARPTSDGKKLNVDVFARVTEFKGFDQEEAGPARPVFSTRTAASNIELAGGETVVLGGIFFEDVQEVEDKVPVFGDAPLIGGAFRDRHTIRIIGELIVIVTPTVVRSYHD